MHNTVSHVVDPLSLAIVDSGIGGLSFLPYVRAAFPQHNIVYFADSLYLPYGDKNTALITTRCQQVMCYLIEHYKIALCILACNTATALAIDTLRTSFDIPIVGVEPGIRSAALLTKIGKIGVLATYNTIHSHRYRSLMQKYASTCQVISQACPGLVERIEDQAYQDCDIQRYLDQCLSTVKAENIDVLVLGCTHYSFCKSMIAAYFDAPIVIIDTIAPVIQRVRSQFTLAYPPGSHLDGTPGRTVFLSTSAISLTARVREYIHMSAIVFQVHHIP